MNIIILGNGFDLAHGLKTKYTDFLTYCKDYHSNENISDDKIIDNTFKKLIDDNLWLKFFYELNSSPNTNWFDFEAIIFEALTSFNKEFIAISKKYNFNTIDHGNSLGNKLAHCIYKFSHKSKNNKENDINYFEILFTENNYSPNNETFLNYQDKNRLFELIFSKLQEFAYVFELYCFHIVDELKKNNKKAYKLNLNIFKNAKQKEKIENFIFSFNYTSTFKELYHDELSSKKGYNNIFYSFIHGQIKDNKEFYAQQNSNNSYKLILGTQKFDRKNLDKNIPMEFNLFQKYNQRHIYRTIDDYQNMLFRLKNNNKASHSIYIIGHSLEKSDHDILKNIFNANPNSEINIFYHDEESHQKYLDNITDIIGDTDVDMRVKFTFLYDSHYGFLLKN